MTESREASTSRLDITPNNESAVRLLCCLWDVALPNKCDCSVECASYRKAQDGALDPSWCTKGKLSRAIDQIGSQLPAEWPDEWEEAFRSGLFEVKP